MKDYICGLLAFSLSFALLPESFAQTVAQLPEAHGVTSRSGPASVELQCVSGSIDTNNATAIQDAVNVNGFAPQASGQTPGAYNSLLNGSGGLRFNDYFIARNFGTGAWGGGSSTSQATWGVSCKAGWVRTGCNYMHLKFPTGSGNGYSPDYRPGSNSCYSDNEEHGSQTGYIVTTCCRVVVN